MYFPPSSSLLSCNGSVTSPKALQQLRSKASIGNIVRLVVNPIGTVGEAVESWRDGLTVEERARKQAIEEKKQILYLRLRNVRATSARLSN